MDTSEKDDNYYYTADLKISKYKKKAIPIPPIIIIVNITIIIPLLCSFLIVLHTSLTLQIMIEYTLTHKGFKMPTELGKVLYPNDSRFLNNSIGTKLHTRLS